MQKETRWKTITAEEARKIRKGRSVRILRAATGQTLICRVDWDAAGKEKILISVTTKTIYTIKNRPGWEYQVEEKK